MLLGESLEIFNLDCCHEYKGELPTTPSESTNGRSKKCNRDSKIVGVDPKTHAGGIALSSSRCPVR